MQTLDLPSEPIGLGRPGQSRYDDPVFNINKRTNVTVHLRRKKLKSIRKTNFECLMRQVLKDVQLSETLEYNEPRAIQEKIKMIHDCISEKKRSKV